MDNYRKKALFISILDGLAKSGGVIFFAIAVQGFPENLLGYYYLIFIIFFLTLVSYFSLFVKNMEKHENLKQKFGQRYLDELERNLTENSMRKLLVNKWFIDYESKTKS